MKFTRGWLLDHLETDHALDDILDALPMLGLEVESIDDPAKRLAAFTVAEVISAEQHPDADRLRVCMVNTGSGDPVQVVCGAPNARAGMKGVFAPAGSYVPGIDLVLKAGNIRGQDSNGMLCSEREMMISDEHDGIIELAADAPVGDSFAAYAGLDDPVIEIAITPNRADCLGVRGVARDLAAAGYGTLKPLDTSAHEGSFDSPLRWNLDLDGAAHLAPLAGEAPRYTALIGPDGELMIGAAALSIYDAASEDVVRSRLAASLDARQPADAVVIDANFPAPVLDMLVSVLPPEMPLCAAATSLAKVDRLAVMLARLSVIVLNRAEASRLAGIQVDDVAVLASTLATSMDRRGSDNLLQDGLVLVSDGGNMAALATGDIVVTAPPPSVRVISANGAGDAMAAGLFSAVLQAEPSPDLDDMLGVALAAGAEFAAKSITGHPIVVQE